MRRLLIAIFVILAGWTVMRTGARANPAEDFTARVAKEFGKIVPADAVKVVGPLVIEISTKSGPHMTYLDNIWSACLRGPETCDHNIVAFVTDMTASQTESEAPVTRDDIRAVVRTTEYMKAPARFRPATPRSPSSRSRLRAICGCSASSTGRTASGC